MPELARGQIRFKSRSKATSSRIMPQPRLPLGCGGLKAPVACSGFRSSGWFYSHTVGTYSGPLSFCIVQSLWRSHQACTCGGEVRAVRTLTPLTERKEFKVQLSVVVQTGPWAHTQLLVPLDMQPGEGNWVNG